MMISKIKFAIKISSLVAVHLLALTVVSNLILAHEQLEQIPKLRDDTHDQLFAGSQQLHHGSIPGHYEFEVAPKMEPPAVRKPPYLQSSQMCPGSGEFNLLKVIHSSASRLKICFREIEN